VIEVPRLAVSVGTCEELQKLNTCLKIKFIGCSIVDWWKGFESNGTTLFTGDACGQRYRPLKIEKP